MKSFSKNRKLQCYDYFAHSQRLKKAIFLTFFLCSILFTSSAQHVPTIVSEDNSTIRALCKDVLAHGWLFFKDDAGLDSTALFRDYHSQVGLGEYDEMKVERDYIDDLGYHFTRYQQFHKGFEVEMAEFLTISEDGRMQVAHGQLAENLSINTLLTIPKTAAVMTAIHSVDATVFSWEVPEIEAEIQETTGDPLATTFPDGELKIAFLGDKELTANNYRLAWKIKVQAVEPHQSLSIYVDALNGEIIKTKSLVQTCNLHHNGVVNPSIDHGTQTFTTRKLSGDYVLQDCDRNIHTKLNGNQFAWNSILNVTDDNNYWGGNRDAATAHWMMQEIWDYYDDVHNRSGSDDNHETILILARSTNPSPAFFQRVNGSDFLNFQSTIA